jgi:hypothetical protein
MLKKEIKNLFKIVRLKVFLNLYLHSVFLFFHSLLTTAKQRSRTGVKCLLVLTIVPNATFLKSEKSKLFLRIPIMGYLSKKGIITLLI